MSCLRHAALALLSALAGCTGSLATNDASHPSDAASGDAVAVDGAALDGAATDGAPFDGAASDAPLADAPATDAVPAADAYVDPCGDPSVIPAFSHGAWNPVLVPRSAVAAQGSDNIYAPDILRLGPHLCLMWYGGQGGDGHDRIFLATSTDCYHWKHYPDDAAPVAVVDNGGSNHVNDPSVVKVGNSFYMYYTDAATGIDDRIHLATSSDGVSWSKQGLVLDVGPAGAWDDFKVGRPSVLHEGGVFYLYYDGNDGTNRHVGLATSADGYTFTKHAANPLVLNAGAIDVEAFDSGGNATLVMLRESGSGVFAHTSADGITWCDQGNIAGLSGNAWDQYGHVTPFAHVDTSGDFAALWVGGASDACWCKNRIGALLPSGTLWPPDPSDGCDGCLSGQPDCTTACRAAAFGIEGYCAHPGSTDPGACCACVPLP